MHYIGYNFLPLDYIIKAHLKAVVASSPELPCKCPHLIKTRIWPILRQAQTMYGVFM